jgi:hypothetical protein
MSGWKNISALEITENIKTELLEANEQRSLQ